MMDGDSNNISQENFKKAVDYLIKNKEKRIGIIGGEPTLHPEFTQLIDYIISKNGIVRLFTNGLISDSKLVNYLSNISNEKLSILVNLNSRDFYSDIQQTYLNNVFEKLNDKIIVGYNIYTENFSLEFHHEIINKYNLNKRVRLGLTSPITGSKKDDFINESNINLISDSIISNIDILEKDDIMVNLDCGFYMCMFSTEQLGILTKKSIGFDSLCRPIIDIDINLDVHRCFPMTGFSTININDYFEKDYNEIETHFDKKFEAFKIFGKKNDCFSCKYLKRKQCRGECFARILNNNVELIEKIK
jgi:MoaA/NifB/PqqE/SkfB family radical SAM enzyme